MQTAALIDNKCSSDSRKRYDRKEAKKSEDILSRASFCEAITVTMRLADRSAVIS